MYKTLSTHPQQVFTAFGRFLQHWICTMGWKIGLITTTSALVFPTCTYWILVGVMSSIGIGFGFHTGPLVLFPHITQVASVSPSFLDAVHTVSIPVVCWGLGTALGEIPPFLMGPHLMRASLNFPSMSAIMEWSRHIVDRFGAVGIFALACWPNATFDCAGTIAGISNMPLWKFMAATILGKTCVKAPMQALVVIATTRGILQFSGDDMAWEYVDWVRPWFKLAALVAVSFAMYCTIESVGNLELEKRARTTTTTTTSI